MLSLEAQSLLFKLTGIGIAWRSTWSVESGHKEKRWVRDSISNGLLRTYRTDLGKVQYHMKPIVQSTCFAGCEMSWLANVVMQ